MKSSSDKQITVGLVTDRFFEPSWHIRFYWNFRAKSFLEYAWHHFVQRELYSKFKWRPSISKGRVNWNRANRRDIRDILQIRVRIFCLSFFHFTYCQIFKGSIQDWSWVCCWTIKNIDVRHSILPSLGKALVIFR